LINYKFILYLDCWNNKPDNRPTINQVVVRLNTIISDFQEHEYNENIQLSSEQLLKSNNEIPENINNSLNENMFQIIQNFNKINIKEIEPLISKNLITHDFELIVNEIISLLENIDIERKKRETVKFLKNYNITSEEVYNYLLNNQDNSNSIFLLGAFNYFGIATNVDIHKAFELYGDAVNLGNAFGMTSLGYCYQNGSGTIVNEQLAFTLYQNAANLGNGRGMHNLGICYRDGIGTSINGQKAFESYQKSANSGNVFGITSLGYCYRNGIETSVDNQKAFELYQKAANLGYYLAQFNLAFMYKKGKGVKQDINQAIHWYKKSAEQGYQIAKNELYKLSKK
jgi:hypothetical protein